MSEILLKKGIIIGHTADDLVFTDTTSQLEITVSDWRQGFAVFHSPQVLAEIISALGTAQRVELLESLGSAGFLSAGDASDVTESTLPIWAVSLAQAVARPSSLSRSDFCLVHTATEVLILPNGLSDFASMESLRLFASGIRPINRRRCYAYGATSGSVSVVGDWCCSSRLEELRARYEGNVSYPVIVSPTSLEESAFARAPGRLHPAQLVIERMIEVKPDLVLHQCGVAVACPDLRFCDVDPDPWAWGHSRDYSLARTKAISEAIERYATGTVPYRRLIKTRANDLDGPYLDPHHVISFTPSQLERHRELRKFLPEEKRYWILGEDSDGKSTYVLADLVYNPFIPPDVNDQRVHCRVSSSGVAYGQDKESAKERALLECVERDAFLRIWYSRVSPPQVSLNSVSRFGKACIESLNKLGWQVSLLFLQGAPPVIAAVGVSEDGLLIGCAAGQPQEATEKALTELSVALTGLPPLSPMRPYQIRKADDHTMLYRDKNIRRHAEFLTGSSIRYEFSDLLWDGKFTIPGDAYFVRLPTVNELSDHVWRAIVPGLIPMTFGYDSEPRGRKDVAHSLEVAASTVYLLFSQDDILLPHPFA